jgi:hypothetical protein
MFELNAVLRLIWFVTLKLFQVIDCGEGGFCHSVVPKDKRSGLINVEKKVRELGEAPGGAMRCSLLAAGLVMASS